MSDAEESKVVDRVNKFKVGNDIAESRKGVKPYLLVVQERVDLAKFKKRLRDLDKDLAKCDRKG